jgi:peroxiredoxin
MPTPPMDPVREIEPFSLPASTGQTLSLDKFKGKLPLVLVFLSDLESNENLELLDELNERLSDFGSERSQVLVVARVTARQAREFADERQLRVALLADASGSMARDYEADDDKGNTRTLAVVADREGVLKRRFDPLPIDGDPDDVVDGLLETVQALGTGALVPPTRD